MENLEQNNFKEKIKITFEKEANSKIYLLNKDKYKNKEEDIIICLATIENADLKNIPKWVKEPEEAKFIGSTRNELTSEEIVKWVDESVVSFLMYKKNTLTNNLEPIAFANIYSHSPTYKKIEIGRLIVSPLYRHKGYGSTLVIYIRDLVEKTHDLIGHKDENLEITLSRVLKSNKIGLNFARSLPFKEDKELSQTDHLHNWFKFEKDINKNFIGDTIADMRIKKNLSQSDLAFLCGVNKTTINMIEHGNRLPSLNLIQKICYSLSQKEQFGRIRILLSCINEEPDKNIKPYKGLTEEILLKSHKKNVWLISDTFAELIDQSFFQESVDAIKSGFERFYFIPENNWDNIGQRLIKRFEKQDISIDLLRKYLRVYEAPFSLCLLRLEIIHDGFKLISITTEGENILRIPLSDVQGNQFFIYIKEVIDELDSFINKEDRSFKFQGFEKKYFNL